MVRVPRKNFFYFAIGALIGFLFSKSSYYERIFPVVKNNDSAQIKNATLFTVDAPKFSADDQLSHLAVQESEEEYEDRNENVVENEYEEKDDEENKNDELQHIQPAGASHFIAPKHNIQVYKMNRLTNRNQKCPYDSSDLAGQRKPLTGYLPKESELEEMMEKLGVVDGCYQPKDCKSMEKVAIIIPFKDREDHLAKWLFHMHQLLVRQRRHYCVIVAEPLGSGHFNKGSTMNAAVKEAVNDGFDCVILHDVDMLLENGQNIYQCQDQPVQLCPFIDKFNYKDHYGTEFGGVTMLTPEQYIKANGYSNLYWGWGKEDDDMNFRIKASGQVPKKPINYEAGRYTMIPHQHPWAFRNNKNTDKDSDLRFLSLINIGNNRYRYKYEGYNSLVYKITDRQNNVGYKKIMVDFRPLDILKATLEHANGESIIMNPYSIDDRGYLELKDTYICEKYGFASVMRWLHNWHASKTSAIDKCNWFPDFCVDVVQKGSPNGRSRTGIAIDFTLREVSQLISGATARKPGGCEPEAESPLVLHKHVYGEQRRLHVIENTLNDVSHQSFNMTLEYTNINGPAKGLYYRHALVWEGEPIRGVIHKELIPPLENQNIEAGKNEIINFNVTIDTPVPGWYTVLSKITDCIGQPMFEWRWAFRVTSGQKDLDDKKIVAADPSKIFKGDEWGLGISANVFKENLRKYYDLNQEG